MRYMLATLALGNMKQKRRLPLIQDEHTLCSESQGSTPLKKLQNDLFVNHSDTEKRDTTFPMKSVILGQCTTTTHLVKKRR